jgi:Mlc titration factor MtfA (ptsG expression regulator)
MMKWLKKLGRQAPDVIGFPQPWEEILRERFPIYAQLSELDRGELKSRIQQFLGAKRFEGCAGLVVTDEIRVAVAAQACLLLLHRGTDCYEGLRSILLYPSTYFARTSCQISRGVVSEEESARLGESWQYGAIVLSWDSVRAGAANAFDGHNVVFHEFAHALDQEDGYADGAPILGRGMGPMERVGAYRSWVRVLAEEYAQLHRRSEKGRKTVLDAYAGSHPAEFFAVATECFFEKPRQLLRKHPQLYAEMQRFYRQDPAAWFGEPPSRAKQTVQRTGAGSSARRPNRTSSTAASRSRPLRSA